MHIFALIAAQAAKQLYEPLVDVVHCRRAERNEECSCRHCTKAARLEDLLHKETDSLCSYLVELGWSADQAWCWLRSQDELAMGAY